VQALEKGRGDEFQEKYQHALDLFAQAKALGPTDFGVNAAMGGAYVVLADRLPKEYRAAAWLQAYQCYRRLLKEQGAVVKRLPIHLRGELLGGLAQSAQRTGRTQEAEEYVDKILALLPGTPYEPVAKKWKTKDGRTDGLAITCLTCHSPGRLAARRAALEKSSR
jgi:tetratricopeptide (TPR) repeat protein